MLVDYNLIHKGMSDDWDPTDALLSEPASALSTPEAETKVASSFQSAEL